MPKFKVGDKVRLVRDYLLYKKGDIHTIESIHPTSFNLNEYTGEREELQLIHTKEGTGFFSFRVELVEVVNSNQKDVASKHTGFIRIYPDRTVNAIGTQLYSTRQEAEIISRNTRDRDFIVVCIEFDVNKTEVKLEKAGEGSAFYDDDTI